VIRYALAFGLIVAALLLTGAALQRPTVPSSVGPPVIGAFSLQELDVISYTELSSDLGRGTALVPLPPVGAPDVQRLFFLFAPNSSVPPALTQALLNNSLRACCVHMSVSDAQGHIFSLQVDPIYQYDGGLMFAVPNLGLQSELASAKRPAELGAWPLKVSLSVEYVGARYVAPDYLLTRGSRQGDYFTAYVTPIFRTQICMTCHSMGDSNAIAAEHNKIGFNFGPSDLHPLTPADCVGCHLDVTNWETPSFSQGIDWATMTSSSQICRTVTKNLPTKALQIQHFHHDPRLQWAIFSGRLPDDKILTTAGGAAAMGLIDVWINLGAPCPAPPCEQAEIDAKSRTADIASLIGEITAQAEPGLVKKWPTPNSPPFTASQQQTFATCRAAAISSEVRAYVNRAFPTNACAVSDGFKPTDWTQAVKATLIAGVASTADQADTLIYTDCWVPLVAEIEPTKSGPKGGPTPQVHIPGGE
jgi:hypothetical protein